MGRPIQKKWFGPSTAAGAQIVVNGVKFADGSTATDAYIVKQTGDRAYVVSNGTKEEIAFMVNATSVGALNAGECFILATPFGGAARPCEKIAQYRVSIYAADGTIDNYVWSTIPATGPGQADLITATAVPGAILSVAVTNAGYGYFSAPSVAFTGGTGAIATAALTGSTVSSITVSAPGSGYTSDSVTLDAPPAAVTATATGTEAAGVIDSVSVVLGGGYYSSAPVVTINGATAGAGADVVATVSGGVVTGFTINNGGSGYDSPISVTVAAPPASVQAVASATRSV